MIVDSRYAASLQQLEEQGRLRTLRPLEKGESGPFALWNDAKLLNLTSNDYLGIGRNKGLQDQFYARYGNKKEQYGLAAASSRLLAGDSFPAHALEKDISLAYGSEKALLFNSGYHANIGILPALCGKNDLILSDKLNHASIHDGLTLSRAAHKRYRHKDYAQLRTLLARHRNQVDQVVIVSETIFSMDGDMADLQELVALKKEFNAMLYLDEAHAVGVRGTRGLGQAEESGILADVDLLVGTFGKALASIGAYVCCSHDICAYLVNHSRSFIFTTALPPVTLHWNRFVFNLIADMDAERSHLQTLSDRLRLELEKSTIKTGGSSNIIPVLIGDDRKALAMAESMRTHGFLIFPVRPPAVPEGTARFRLSLSSDMQWRDLQPLVPAIKAADVEGKQ